MWIMNHADWQFQELHKPRVDTITGTTILPRSFRQVSFAGCARLIFPLQSTFFDNISEPAEEEPYKHQHCPEAAPT